MTTRRQLRAGALRGDDRELQARLVLVLNQLQEKNERSRGYLVDGNLAGLVSIGRVISDLGTTLMLVAAGQGSDQGELFDARARAAGAHLDR